MKFWLVLLILLSPALSLAQYEKSDNHAPSSSGSRNFTVYRSEIGIDYYTDHQGTTGWVQRDLLPGMSHYNFTDRDGHRSSGYIFEPLPLSEPLRVPEPGAPIEQYLR